MKEWCDELVVLETAAETATFDLICPSESHSNSLDFRHITAKI